MRHYILPALVTGLLFGAGCYAGTGTYATASYGGPVGYYDPDLAYVGPGVQVVAGYDQPVFYSDNFYWRYDNNRWFRSSYYDRGWSYATPPRAVLSIDRPYRYRNYRPAGYVGRDRGPMIRDQRGYQQRPVHRQDRRGYQPVRGQVRQAPVRGQVHQAPVHRGAPVHRQAPIRGTYRGAPAQRQAPARNDNRRIRDQRR